MTDEIKTETAETKYEYAITHETYLAFNEALHFARLINFDNEKLGTVTGIFFVGIVIANAITTVRKS